MIIVRQSTARTVTVGPVLDADGVAVTGGVVGDLKISKNGGAPAALNGSATLTHRHTGFYSLALTASDLDTVGSAEVTIDDTVNAMPMKEVTVMEEATYDALFAASANGFAGAAGSSTVTFSNTSIATVTTLTNLPAITAGWLTATGIAADAITAAKIADGAIDAATFAAGAITAAAIAADAITAAKIADGAIDANTFAAGAINNAAVSFDGSELTAIPWAAAWDAEVQSEVQDAIEANHLDHLLAAAYDPASKPGASDALLNELVENDGGVARYTANALEQGPSGGGGVADWTADERTALRTILGIPASGTTPDDPSAGILDTIRDRTLLLSTQASVDDLPTNAELATAVAAADDATLAAIAALNNLSAAGVRTELATELARIDVATSTRMATYTQPTGFLAATFPATVASTTNITGGTITTVTTLTNLPAITANWLTAAGIAADAGAEIAAAVLAGGDIDGYSLEEAQKLILAASAGEVSGAETTEVTIRAADDSKVRITATVTADGNRTALTLDETD